MLTKAELQEKREPQDAWANLVYEGLWFSPLRKAIDAFVDATQEQVDGRGAGRAPRRRPRRQGGARRRRSTPRLASYGAGDTFPHEAAEGFIRIMSLETELAAARARKGGGGMTLWAGRVARRSRPRSGLPAGGRRGAAPVRLRGDARPRAATHAAGLLADASARGRARSSGSAGGQRCVADRRGRALGDRAAARRRRPQDPCRTLAQRPGRRGVAAVRRRRCAEARGDRRARAGCSTAEPEATRSMPGYTHLQRAQPVTLGHHLLAWVEMLERDRPVRRRRAGGAEPARLGRARRFDAAAPAPPNPMRGTRSTPWPTATSRSTTCTRRRRFSHLSRIGEELVTLVRPRSSASRLPRTRRPARR